MGDTFLKSAFLDSSDAADYLKRYLARLAALLAVADAARLAQVAEALEETIAKDGSIFLMGNGGSSAAGSHLVNDLGPNSLADRAKGVRIFNLTDNAASVTAVANDIGYEAVFLAQLKAYLRSGDLVVGFSVSGNSPNIVSAATFAKQAGNRVIGFTGFSGGLLGKVADIHVNFATTGDEYGPVEDLFSIAGHAISGYLTMKRGRWLHH